MSKKKILILDDEKNMTLVVQAILEKGGFEVDSFNDSLHALQVLNHPHEYSLVITDLFMPKMTGIQLLAELQAKQPGLPVILMTAFGTVENAVQALKTGAFDFITKPFDQGELLRVVEKAVQTSLLRNQEPLAEAAEGQLQQSLLVGRSPQMQEILRLIHKIAASPSTVLITGESGTGKELVALEIHRNSDRADKPFIKINCAAIPHNLIESELFGYEKGAFTGAVSSKPGRFELAHQGTLFLDEVAEMPLEMQVKLLRAIQESEFERVGGLETIKINVRLIAATNRDMLKEVAEGRLREDLYYRLNVVPIFLPPLRERRGDIEDLVYFFIRKFNGRLNKHIQAVDPACLQALIHFSWPGNIRQLENVIERAVLMSEEPILRLIDLPSEVTLASPSTSAAKAMPPLLKDQVVEAYQSGESFKDIVKRQTQAVEKEIIEQVLQENDGNVTKTAEKLGLSRKGLQIKLKELNIVK